MSDMLNESAAIKKIKDLKSDFDEGIITKSQFNSGFNQILLDMNSGVDASGVTVLYTGWYDDGSGKSAHTGAIAVRIAEQAGAGTLVINNTPAAQFKLVSDKFRREATLDLPLAA